MNAAPAVVEVAFALLGRELPRDHHLALAEALCAALPWLAAEDASAIRTVRLVPGVAARALLSARSRLVLRVPRERSAALAALEGARLDVDGCALVLGAPQPRELLPHGTLHAAFVDAAGADEAGFLAAVARDLERLDIRCEAVCGRAQERRGPGGPLHGFALMLHGLRRGAAQRVLERGIGAHRLLGCGVFVPHRSVAAVGEQAA